MVSEEKEIISEKDVLHRIQERTITVSLSSEDLEKWEALIPNVTVRTPGGDMSEFDFVWMAVEKQIPKKPIVKRYSWWADYHCPKCEKIITDSEEDKFEENQYCRYCGQRLDWSDLR